MIKRQNNKTNSSSYERQTYLIIRERETKKALSIVLENSYRVSLLRYTQDIQCIHHVATTTSAIRGIQCLVDSIEHRLDHLLWRKSYPFTLSFNAEQTL